MLGCTALKSLHTRFHLFIRFTLVVLPIVVGSCHEFLPPRLDPKNVFEGTIEGRYVLAASENAIEVCLKATNIFDETLQSTALLDGTLVIVFNSDTSYHKTVILGPRYLFSGNYDSVTHILTIDPGSSIHLKYVWNFIDDRGRDLRREVFQYFTDSSCAFRKIALQESLRMRAELKVFNHTDVVNFGPVDFTFSHVSDYVDSKTCRSIKSDTPCGLIH